jgi:hypothetical protein
MKYVPVLKGDETLPTDASFASQKKKKKQKPIEEH